MAHITRIIASTTVLLIGLLLPHSVQAAGLEPGTPITPIENTYTDAEQTLIDWAIHRFLSAGLTPPSADFVFHPSAIDCYGHVGLYYPQSDTVHMCRLDKHSILHELAHAWVHENLTSTAKAAFVTSRDLMTWNDHDKPWELRGTEHAAETIAWALLDRNRLVRWVGEDGAESYRLLTIPDSGPAELASAFELLTGVEPTERLLDDPSREASQTSANPEAHRESRRSGSRLETADRRLVTAARPSF